MMNPEQQAVYNAVMDDRTSVLMTGTGGVGKTYVLNKIIKSSDITNKGVTATTGSAAILLNGTTIHSFLGIGLGDKPVKDIIQGLMRKGEHGKRVITRLLQLELLIIDEISMMNDQLFDLISELLSTIRNNPLPFGGVQVMLSGDLFQIPPFTGRFFFKSKTWKRMRSATADAVDGRMQMIEMRTSQRHKDADFVEMLNKLKYGECDEETLAALKATEDNTFADGIVPSILYMKNADVDIVNNYEMEKLIEAGAIEHKFHLKTSPGISAKAWATSAKIPESVKLCIGAQVMLKWNVNVEIGLCNGARGIVTGFTPTGVRVRFQTAGETIIEPIKLEHPDSPNLWIKFMPLRLAWALTINVAQGATLDAVIVDMNVGHTSPDFLYGKFYTAISRVRDLKSIIVRNANKNYFMAHPDVLKFMPRL
jgi:ATP-dependent DNA helicase PIF1